MDSQSALRVASVPAGHPYVRGITPSTPGVRVLPDPIPAGRPPGQWWPPVVLTEDWLRAERPDVLHVHFGYESLTVDEVARVLTVVRELRIGLVVTVHDLANPQLTDQTRHQQQLALLLAAADEVVTLTDGAARLIAAEHDRQATVLPHPTLLDHPAPVPAAPPAGIGLHLKSLRAGTDLGAVADVVAVAAELGEVCTMSVHPGVRGPLTAYAARSHVRWWEHQPLTEAELERWLVTLGVLVLPYAHGTHSGLLELCRDLGVPVAVPNIGQHADQQPDPALLASWPPGDREALRAALARLLAGRDRVRPADRATRLAERQAVAERHARLWRDVARRGVPA